MVTTVLLPSGVGKMKSKPKFTQVFSNIVGIALGLHQGWAAVLVLAAALLSFGLPEIKVEGNDAEVHSV